ncbi:MAG: RdgB/HAM1 family non-canonical purine NTP pyrophosphatase [Myxococcota bacterium]|nr:RdgB/HAM1 family non-canonical purine NTP pyrophosphatase [Myxococcota bacterium]
MSGPEAEADAHRPELVLATANPGKRREFAAILGDVGVQLRTLAEFPETTLPPEGTDYEANAVAKARAVAEATGRPALGDDSGLEVDALDGAPGPLSARFGGPGLDDAGRVEALLEAVRRRGPDAPRGARFVCVAALATHDGRVEVARGACPGRLLEAPRGTSGFGYDPVFVPEGETRTMAELSPAQKHCLSHRGRALAALRPAVAALAHRPG